MSGRPHLRDAAKFIEDVRKVRGGMDFVRAMYSDLKESDPLFDRTDLGVRLYNMENTVTAIEQFADRLGGIPLVGGSDE